jgi:TPP-dependent pyruvate/acetoin dehydrogenase alpha subunit
LRGGRQVTCCFFGDGAVAEGEFHEAMNLAVLWQLPVLFLCENNYYAMGTALRFTHANMDLAGRAASYGMLAEAVDGMDVLAVEEAACRAAAAVRDGHGPSFLEARTYRFRAHSMFDAELYREKAEVEEWKKRDPLPRLTRHLQELGLLRETDLEDLERAVTAEIEDAVAFAEAGTWEPVEDLLRFVYST